MEVLGKDVKTSYSTVHAPAYNGGGGIGAPYTLPGNADFSDDFHTWAADWNSRGITYSLDGRIVFSLDKDQVEQTRGPWIFDHPHYVILNLAVGGDWPGPTDAADPLPRQDARRLRAGLSVALPADRRSPGPGAAPPALRGGPGARITPPVPHHCPTPALPSLCSGKKPTLHP